MEVDMYCPKCGQITDVVEIVMLSPGDDEAVCPKCKTIWKVEIEFHEMAVDSDEPDMTRDTLHQVDEDLRRYDKKYGIG